MLFHSNESMCFTANHINRWRSFKRNHETPFCVLPFLSHLKNQIFPQTSGYSGILLKGCLVIRKIKYKVNLSWVPPNVVQCLVGQNDLVFRQFHHIGGPCRHKGGNHYNGTAAFLIFENINSFKNCIRKVVVIHQSNTSKSFMKSLILGEGHNHVQLPCEQ